MADVICSRTRAISAFDPSRLYESVLSACYAVRLAEGVALDTATHICKLVDDWLHTKSEVTSHDIRLKAGEILSIQCPEAGYFYQHQHTIL